MLRKRSFSTLQRTLSSRHHFTFFADFLSLAEQHVLLSAALQKLDSMESTYYRRRRKAWIASGRTTPSTASNPLQNLFFPDDCYKFEEGHFDGVIRNYREMHLTSWPDVPGLPAVLERLSSVLPSQNIQTHLLHLASNGEIFPHVDNFEASGSWILGVSLGSERLLHMKGPGNDCFDALLPSGSVYIQRDSLRFNYEHSIPLQGAYNGRKIYGGQRLSIMIRDKFSPPADSKHT